MIAVVFAESQKVVEVCCYFCCWSVSESQVLLVLVYAMVWMVRMLLHQMEKQKKPKAACYHHLA
jgi:hypothetical protein